MYGKKTWCVADRMPRLCITNKDLPEILQTCPCASKPATFVLVSEQLVVPAGHSSGAERKSKNKTSHFKQSFFFYISCDSGDVLISLQIIDCRFRC